MQEMFRRRRLPHWDVPGATYFITTCLEGSIPAEGLLDIVRYRIEQEKRERPAHISEEDWKRDCWKRVFAKNEEWLDLRPAVRHLEEPALAKIVTDAFYFFAGQRYDLLAYVVMPSHCHWVFTPLREWEEKLPEGKSAREKIMQSIKRHSAYECQRYLGGAGVFWQRESYDHCVEDLDELQRIIDYIELNPVKAGLVASRELWPFSSAHARLKLGIPFGRVLLKPYCKCTSFLTEAAFA